MNTTSLSVIIPFKNEEENLVELARELKSVLNALPIRSEAVFVDDGSTDSSYKVLEEEILKSKNGKISYVLISLRKNFGQTAASVAGIDNSTGGYISFLDADLQNDPNDIPRFLEKFEEGYDAVFGWRKYRRDASLRSIFSRIANWTVSLVFSYPYHDLGCSARIVKRKFVEGLDLYGELHRIMPVLIYLRGAKVGEIVVKHRKRTGGRSKYGFERIVKTVIDIITVKFLSSYGTKPAYVFGTFGLGSMFLSGLTVTTVAYRKLFLGVFVHRDPLFLISIFLGIVGIQFIMMGLLAELQVRTYFGSQKKSIYEIKTKETF